MSLIIAAFDPGGTTGWAKLRLTDRHLEVLDIGESKDPTGKDLIPLLEEADYIVVEDFLVDPKKAMAGHLNYDRMPAPKMIGVINSRAADLGKSIKLQPNTLKPPAYGLAGMVYKKGKKGAGTHMKDALAHGVYFAVKTLNALPLTR